MRRRALGLTVLLLLAALGINASIKDDSGNVEIATLDASNWDEFAPGGKEVDAIYGDLVLRNKHLVAVIAQPLASRHANMTVRDVAGCLIDLTTRENQADQLSAFYPGSREFPYRNMRVTMGTADSAKGGDAQIGQPGKPLTGHFGTVRVRADGTADRPSVEVRYSLLAGSRFLQVTSRFSNETDKSLVVPLEDNLRLDTRKEDIIKAPNSESDLFWVHDRFWGQAYGIQATEGTIVSNSNTRTSTLRYATSSGRKVTLQPGESFELARRIFPASDLPDVRSIAKGDDGDDVTLTLNISDGNNQPIPNARVTLIRDGHEWGMTVADAQGTVHQALPNGQYAWRVEALGVDITPANPGTAAIGLKGPDVSFKMDVRCTSWKPGTVNVAVTDGNGDAIPCKVDFLAKEGTQQPWFGPESADFGTMGLRYAAHGEVSQSVPPGEYEVVISHGPEYDAVFRDVTVPPGKTVEVKAELKHVVDTTGWISSDFHSHSSPSGDNTGSQLGRVLNLVCDHIEFAPCTEHNRVDSYQPHIDRLKIGQFISSCSGMELTGSPLLLNHQNAFPMKFRPHLQDGGGPVTDGSVEKQVERLALWDDRSEKLVQINHPDMGWMFRDANGDGTPDDGHPGILPLFDVVEIHPVPDILTLDPSITASNYKGNNRIYNWLQFLNQGYLLRGVVNTDAHYNYHESGWLRNWIKSPTDDPSGIKPLDVVRASEAGAVVMSNGPFLEVSMTEAGKKGRVIAGQDLEAPSGKILISARVQCPNWIDLDRVFVLVNGRIHPKHHYRKATHPNVFRSGVVRFEERLELTLKEDAHVIVVAGAENSKLGRVHGPVWGEHTPAALHNPVFVDVDGGGFKANGDTLDHPLPVRFGYPKK